MKSGNRVNYGEATRVRFIQAIDQRVADYAQELLGDAQLGDLVIDLATVGADVPALGDDETYMLVVNDEDLTLRAVSTWGAIWGLTSLWQLHENGALQASGWRIEDAPRFPWRGLLIDVARHFIPLISLLAVIDGMALVKLNVLHLHLSDDQGFRMACRAFPKLASEQHYSQAELSQLVAYAAQRGIRIVPEIDVPGHVNCWLTAYPEWGLQAVEPSTRFGVHKACLDVTSEAVYAALDNIFSEVSCVFPDQYLHIGGDEVHPAWWQQNSRVQSFIAQHQLQDERGLQAYFNQRLCDVLAASGKLMVGWDEVLHPQMPTVLVQNWRGATTRDRALVAGQACIVSAGYYLDLFYPADLHYRYDPEANQTELIKLEDSLAADMRLAHVSQGISWTHQWRDAMLNIDDVGQRGANAKVLGGEACLWAELVDDQTLAMRLWSRLPAVAERLWSPRSVQNIENFYHRLGNFMETPRLGLAMRLHEQLEGLGLSIEQVEIVKMLEPVKWYARLLGSQALQARLMGREMPQARPYQCDTPLNRVVDYISPESLAARGLADKSEAELSDLFKQWQASVKQHWPEDVAPAVRHLAEVAVLMLSYFSGDIEEQSLVDALTEAYQPSGEYMLAPVPALLSWLSQRRLGVS